MFGWCWHQCTPERVWRQHLSPRVQSPHLAKPRRGEEWLVQHDMVWYGVLADVGEQVAQRCWSNDTILRAEGPPGEGAASRPPRAPQMHVLVPGGELFQGFFLPTKIGGGGIWYCSLEMKEKFGIRPLVVAS